MKKKKPILFDHLGAVIEKGYPQTGDPGFLYGTLNKGTTSEIERKPYAFHSWVFACVYAIVRNVATLPHALYEWRDEDSELIYEHEVLKLFRKPNPLMSGSELWEYVVLNLMLPTTKTPGGQCFLVPESGKDQAVPNVAKGQIPKELWPFSDEVIKPRRDPKTKILNGWKFQVAGIMMHEFELDEVIRIRLVNPYNIEQGLSPFSAAKLAVKQDVKSDEYNTKFFENMGVLGGVLSTNEEIDPLQARQIKREFMEEYGGSHNAGSVAVFGLGVKYEQFLKSHLDMQFSEMRLDNRTRIQAVYGVPDEEIAIFSKGMNRATAQQADKNFWQKTLLPLDKKIMDGLNIQFIENLDRGQWRIKSDLSKVEALKNIYTDEIKDAERLVKMHVPPAEALRTTGVPVAVDKYAWLETAYINQSMVPIESAGSHDDGGGDNEPDGGGEDEGKITPIFNSTKVDKIMDAAIKADENERRELSARWIKGVLNPGEKAMHRKMQKWFATRKREMLDNVDAWLATQEPEKSIRQILVNPKKFVFDPRVALAELEEVERVEATKQTKREAKYLKDQYGEAIQWDATDENIAKFIRERQVYVNQINTHVFNAARTEIGQIVQEGIENNWTPQELSKELKTNIKAIKTEGAAKRVARTEMGSISNRARADAFIKSDIKQHQWVTSRDERVRQTHMIDGEIVYIGDNFSNGLMFPQQPGAPAAEVINCRCVSVPII